MAAATLATAPASSAVERAVRDMTLREKVGQLVMFRVAGTGLSTTERDLIVGHHLGGVILFRDNYSSRSQLARLSDQIQRAVRRGSSGDIGALISVDQEGGVVKRFPDMPPHHSAPEMGRIGRTGLALDEGRATGRALSSVGVNMNLAPVADLDLPPSHVMRERSFGTNRYKVARLATAFGLGLQRRKVAATLKHFPGFGGSNINSDDGRAYVRRTKWQLHHVDAIPFQRAIRDGIKAVMLSHGMYLRDGGRRPASVNRYIASERLRGEFGFEGVAISDDLNALAWRFDGNTAAACKATIKAGVDVALITGDAGAAAACVRAIRTAVRAGSIRPARIDRAVERVLELKTWLGLYEDRT